MIRNETFTNGVCVHADIIDLDAGTVTTEDHGQVVSVRPLTDDERRQYGPSPLDPTGALATLLAVVGTLDVDDAANAVGLTADDLVAEAQAWAMGDDVDPLQYNVI
jgi:hypothetical protein